ncbi:hypothetical protein ACLOJK_034524, partial [Asimina triloba]
VKDLNELKVDDLRSSLMAHEMIIYKREEPGKNKKGFALKAVDQSSSKFNKEINDEEGANP